MPTMLLGSHLVETHFVCINWKLPAVTWTESVGMTAQNPSNTTIFISTFALWANAELYISGPSLPFSLSPFLSPEKLEKSLHFDARTLKLCRRHPWTQSLRFRENQNLLYVCQSVSWLTSLLKLDKYGDISYSWRDMLLIFLKTFLRWLFTSYE